jgi:hypothetical protein
MLPENEIRQRAEYCYLVFLQLSRLRDNMQVAPERYLDYLGRSTLRLAEDEFIRSIVEEELKMGSHDGGLGYLKDSHMPIVKCLRFRWKKSGTAFLLICGKS